MSEERPVGCPICRHSMPGFHVAYPPSATPWRAKATDENVWCAWCDRWCVKDGVRRVAS